MEKSTYRGLRFEDKKKLIQKEYEMYQYAISILGEIYALIESSPEEFDEQLLQDEIHKIDANILVEPYYIVTEGCAFSLTYRMPDTVGETMVHLMDPDAKNDPTKDSILFVRPMMDFAVMAMIATEQEKILRQPSLDSVDQIVAIYHRLASNLEEFFSGIEDREEIAATEGLMKFTNGFPIPDIMQDSYWENAAPEIVKGYFLEVKPETV